MVMQVKPLKPPRIRDWVACFAVLILAVLVFAMGLYQMEYGVTPKEQLTEVSGVAEDVEWDDSHSKGSHDEYVTFSVGDYRFQCSNYDPYFAQLQQSIKEGKVLSVKLSTKRENLFRLSSLMPIYELSVEGEQLLAYEDTVSRDYANRSRVTLVIGGVLLLISLLSFHHHWQNRKLRPI